jgi:hypothetical protein
MIYKSTNYTNLHEKISPVFLNGTLKKQKNFFVTN